MYELDPVHYQNHAKSLKLKQFFYSKKMSVQNLKCFRNFLQVLIYI